MFRIKIVSTFGLFVQITSQIFVIPDITLKLTIVQYFH
jgi:hypothetical protein